MNKFLNSEDLLIIDGYGFLFRAYYAQPELTNINGLATGALFGFTNMLTKIIKEFKPHKAVIAFDCGGENFRHRLYPHYKTNRPQLPENLLTQLPLAREVASVLGFCIIEQQGYEADDLIATIVRKSLNPISKIIVMSGDKDLLQLIQENVLIYDPMKNKYLDSDYVMEKFGVTPDKLREAMALIGDTSDNIPGVKGIGPKTATQLINQFNNIENLLQSLDQISNVRHKKLIEEAKDNLLLSWHLVGLDSNIDIELQEFLVQAPHLDILRAFILKYDFKSLYNRMESILASYSKNSFSPINNSSDDNKATKEISNVEALNEIMLKAQYSGILLISIIHTKKTMIILLSTDNNLIYTITTINDQPSVNLSLLDTQTNNDWFIEIIKPYIANNSIKKITINIKELRNIFGDVVSSHSTEDVLIMDYLLTGCKRFNYKYNYQELEQIIDSFITLKETYQQFLHSLIDNGLFTLYKEVDMPLSDVIYQIEKNGITIHTQYLNQLASKLKNEITTIEANIFKITGVEFNIASPKQLGEVLFDKLLLPLGKKNNKSRTYTTNIEILEQLEVMGYEIASLLIKWRKLDKLLNTYAQGMQQHISSIDNRIHTTFLQCSTNTSRLSSVNPNLQNIPVNTNEGIAVRSAFIASEGSYFLAADYSQIELRILSDIANVRKLKEALINGFDIHLLTACDIFKIATSEVTPTHRRKAKAINFGIIYGISPFGLAKQIDATNEEASHYIKEYFTAYPEIKKYMDDTIEYAKIHGYVSNFFGRKSFIDNINSDNHTLRQMAQRAAINAPIQSTSADIIKIAMNNLSIKLKEYDLKAKMILQIHDELLFEVPNNEIKKIASILKKAMELASPLSVPAITELKIGNDLGHMTSYIASYQTNNNA